MGLRDPPRQNWASGSARSPPIPFPERVGPRDPPPVDCSMTGSLRSSLFSRTLNQRVCGSQRSPPRVKQTSSSSPPTDMTSNPLRLLAVVLLSSLTCLFRQIALAIATILQWWLTSAVVVTAHSAAESRRTHPVRPPPEPRTRFETSAANCIIVNRRNREF
jgi:hypothetical protein